MGAATPFIPLITGAGGAILSNNSDRPQSAPPGVIPGFEFLIPFLQQFAQSIGGGNFNFLNPGTPSAGSVNRNLANLGTTANQAGNAFQQGLLTGFLPETLGAFEDALRPGFDRRFEEGQANILEQSANLGTLTSSATTNSVGDLSAQLGNEFQNILGNAGVQFGSNAQNIQGQLASQFPQLLSTLFNQGNFSSQLGLNAVNTLTGGANQTPFFQPLFGQSSGDSLAGLFGAAGTSLTDFFNNRPGNQGGGGGLK